MTQSTILRIVLLVSVVLSFSWSCDAWTTTTWRQGRALSSVVQLYSRVKGQSEERRRRQSRTTRRDKGSRRPPPSTATRRTRQAPANSATPFDGKALTALQQPNEDASSINLKHVLHQGDLKYMSDGKLTFADSEKDNGASGWQFLSLDEVVYPGLSKLFNHDQDFRNQLRQAIRQDIFDTTPFYANLPEKAVQVLLLPDSSLEGSWRSSSSTTKSLRMVQTTRILQQALGTKELTGDILFSKIGELCGPDPTTHFIDIYGVQDRAINHAWHMDAASRHPEARTVIWGFPAENDYDGCGVFSHFVPLTRTCVAPPSHPRMEPLLFAGQLSSEYKDSIIRPRYAPGRELLVFRDGNFLHSAPDVTYRTSLMRFM